MGGGWWWWVCSEFSVLLWSKDLVSDLRLGPSWTINKLLMGCTQLRINLVYLLVDGANILNSSNETTKFPKKLLSLDNLQVLKAALWELKAICHKNFINLVSWFLVAEQLYTWPCLSVCFFVYLFFIFDMKYLPLWISRIFKLRKSSYTKQRSDRQQTNTQM